MDFAYVSLHDPETSWQDPAAKSIGFFSKRTTVRLDSSVVDEIKELMNLIH